MFLRKKAIEQCTEWTCAPLTAAHTEKTRWTTTHLSKYRLYLYLQHRHQSSPETVLSRWNLGVGHESLRQNKPHSAPSLPYPRKDKPCRNTTDFLTDSVEPLCTIYWKIPVWVPTDVPLMFLFVWRPNETMPFQSLCMDFNSSTAPQWWKLQSCSSLTHGPLTIVLYVREFA